MIRIKKSEKVLFVLTAAFLSIFIMEKVISGIFTSKTEVLDKEAKVREENFEKGTYIEANREKIAGIFDSVKPYVEINGTDEEIYSIFMKNIEETAKNNDVMLLKMRPENLEGMDTDTYKTRRITLSVEGTQSNLIRFFYVIENSKYAINIAKLDLKTKDRGINLMSAELELYFIYFA